MKRRVFLASSVALAFTASTAYAESVEQLNKLYADSGKEGARYQQLLSYVNSIEAALASGQFTGNGLIQAYRNLGAIKSFAQKQTGSKWALLAARAEVMMEKVAAVYKEVFGGDIAKDAKVTAKKLGELVHPPIVLAPDEKP